MVCDCVVDVCVCVCVTFRNLRRFREFSADAAAHSSARISVARDARRSESCGEEEEDDSETAPPYAGGRPLSEAAAALTRSTTLEEFSCE